uniref:Uncharacterized protein n=1 Tax=Romanomermis culicivorax TaxID=13658 RepID=A0A915IGA0_ROMCU
MKSIWYKESIGRRDQTSKMKEAKGNDWRKKIVGIKTSRDAKGVATGAVLKEKQSMIPSYFAILVFICKCVFCKSEILEAIKRVFLFSSVLCIVEEQVIVDFVFIHCCLIGTHSICTIAFMGRAPP